ncbi:ribosome maturation factor RimM [Gulbenkiania mobilis]|uniref:ribosome maturation factor RimM n=1 Tax=Gulbenkiania mobilis TaxID=397457 RepID=UPI0006BBC1C2|nr:ribosome maturation factor RimM [Gulbenkiania mobilis]
MQDNDLVVMGHVSGAFGVRGWVKIHADTEYADSLFDYPVWWLNSGQGWKAYTLETGAVQPKALVAKLEGVDDRDVAAALRGCRIAVPRSELPPTEEDEYYWSDLIGLEVFNREDAFLGRVTDLMATGASDVLVLQDGDTQRMIPFVSQYIVDVSLANCRIVADWGLDY